MMTKQARIRPALLALTLLVILGISGSSSALSASVGWSVSFSSFHGALAPYGTWVTIGNYGRCWRPSRVSIGWQPYANGEWLYTDYGWTWVSYDPWGEIPYHYGTWIYEPGYGWVWVPGYVWGPAWVTWCDADDFIGWAPLSPSFVLTTSGYFGRAVVDPPSRYVFVPTRSFVGLNAATVRVPATRNATLLRRGTPTTRFSVAGHVVRASGPDPKRIESMTHRAIRPTGISAAKLHPTRVDAGGRIRGSRVAVTSRVNSKAAPQTTRMTATRRAPATSRGTVTRIHETRHAAPRKSTPTMTARRASPKTHAAPKHVVVRHNSSAHPRTTATAHRSVAPRNPVPRTHVAKTAEHPKTMVRPSPVVAHERPAVHAAPPVQAHAAPPPRVESRPAPGPRLATRHAPPAPRAPKKESGRK